MDKVEYFISYNMIAHSIFKRVPNRYELTAIKNGLEELLNKRMIKIETTYSKSEMVLNLTNLYYKKMMDSSLIYQRMKSVKFS